MYIWNCPKCNLETVYTVLRHWKNAVAQKSCCQACKRTETATRTCPRCNKEITTQKRSCLKNKLCRSCTKKENYQGENNPFFGKRHSDETKEKISNFLKTKKISEKTRQKMSVANTGDKNSMFGRSLHQVWTEKYGILEADERMAALAAKRSINATGKNNPMYGKPCPVGSGNGWSGWYNNQYFRSLRELSYIILVLEKNGKCWASAENIKIEYVDVNGKNRTYHPDFIIDKKHIVEIKPTALQNTESVKLKCSAAEQYCMINEFTFTIVDPPMLSTEEFQKLYKDNKIKLLKRWEEKYLKLWTPN